MLTKHLYDFVYDDERKIWINATDGLNDPMPFPKGMKLLDWIGYIIERKNAISRTCDPLPSSYNSERAWHMLNSAKKAYVFETPDQENSNNPTSSQNAEIENRDASIKKCTQDWGKKAAYGNHRRE